jgi:hypothetical protein
VVEIGVLFVIVLILHGCVRTLAYQICEVQSKFDKQEKIYTSNALIYRMILLVVAHSPVKRVRTHRKPPAYRLSPAYMLSSA